eukprot:jgi/Chlat1/1021/Chrsp109S01458
MTMLRLITILQLSVLLALWFESTSSSSSSSSSPRHHRELRVQHILVDPSDSDLLDSLHTRIAGGEDMGELAEEYSKCPSRKKGGDIGEPLVVGVMQVEELASVLDDEGNDEWAPRISSDLDPNKETLVLCHHGVRSLQAANFLLSQGFTNVKNVEGGIHAYSTRVNSSVPVY